MKRILVAGRLKDVRTFRCPVCGCIFESDEYNQALIGGIVHAEEDECPNCGTSCHVYIGDEEGEE